MQKDVGSLWFGSSAFSRLIMSCKSQPEDPLSSHPLRENAKLLATMNFYHRSSSLPISTWSRRNYAKHNISLRLSRIFRAIKIYHPSHVTETRFIFFYS